MPVFSFRVPNRDTAVCSIPLPDITAARAEALRLAGELMRDAAQTQNAGDGWRVEVLNEAGLRVVEVNVTVEMTMPAKRATPSA